MIKYYRFNYDFNIAEAYFKVDTNKFKEDSAKLLLEFFSWEFNENENPIDELMKKYAMKAIKIATSEFCSEEGVKSWFSEQEGFISLDGSQGVELSFVSKYEFDENRLEMDIEIK